MRFSLSENKSKNVLYIVDEASMIGGESQSGHFGVNNLLEDLMTFVNDGENCALLFIGDVAQLPPVGTKLSPALAPNHLQRNYSLSLDHMELRDVVRQEQGSGILHNATHLRELLLNKSTDVQFTLSGFDDVFLISGNELENELDECYRNYGDLNAIVLTRSNKRANQFNGQIRTRILQREDTLCGGDILMVVKNNYFWLDKEHSAGFIANGDTMEVQRIKSTESKYGFQFATAEVLLSDYPDDKPFEVKLLLDTLDSESASLSFDDLEKLYQNIAAAEHPGANPKSLRKKIGNNPYYNALQVKFAYAITCHKSQGGQWEAVFVDQGYLREDMVDVEWLRWLYTAITRATTKLYFVNFSSQFFEPDSRPEVI